MSVRSNQSVTVVFTTRDFSTGVLTSADSTPTGVLYVNGSSTGQSININGISTGTYSANSTTPTLNFGDVAEIVITATVTGITDSSSIWRDVKDENIDSGDNNPLVTTQSWQDSGTGIVSGVKVNGSSFLMVDAEQLAGNSMTFDGANNLNVNAVGLTYDANNSYPLVTVRAFQDDLNAVATPTFNNGLLRVDPAGVWDTATSGLTTLGSVGKLLVDNVDSPISEAGGTVDPNTEVILQVVKSKTFSK